MQNILNNSFFSIKTNTMNQSDIYKRRTKKLALEIIKLFRLLPKTEEAKVIGRQLLRSSTSVAANYRSVCRARSKADFIAKIGLVVEEADETVFWLEIIMEAEIFNGPLMQPIFKEANEILAIMAASQMTSKSNR
jgi:four helix bundle protein